MDQDKIARLESQLQAARRKGDKDDVARLEKALATERAVPDAPATPAALPHEKIAGLQSDLAEARKRGDSDAEARLSKEITDLGGVPDPAPPRGPDPAGTFRVPDPKPVPLSAADTASLKAHGDLVARISALEDGQRRHAGQIAELRAPKTP